MTRPLTCRFAAPSPRFAGRGISHEVLLPACGEKVVLTRSVAKGKDRMRGVSLEVDMIRPLEEESSWRNRPVDPSPAENS
jgi:hypothetical protein